MFRLRLSGGGAQATRALFASPSQVQSAAGLLGLVILVWSVLSFARALERVYLDCWGLPPVRRLLPTAAISGASVLAFGVGSVIFMPRIVTHDAQRYGYIGVAFALVTWLFCLAAVIIAAAVLGALQDQWRRGLPGAVASSERDDASDPLRA